jgi:SEC-C motif-containing protein
MRSRYSAYAMNDAQYIFNTYANSTRIEQSITEIESSAESCQWIKLNVQHCSDWNNSEAVNNTALPTVEFDAYYLTGNKVYQLSEKSRFIKEISNGDGQSIEGHKWFYLDGDIIKHSEIETIKRNDLCPCQKNQSKENKKKFKKCCGSKI